MEYFRLQHKLLVFVVCHSLSLLFVVFFVPGKGSARGSAPVVGHGDVTEDDIMEGAFVTSKPKLFAKLGPSTSVFTY